MGDLRSPLRLHLIDTFSADGRFGSICRYRDPPALAPAFVRQDAVNCTNHDTGRNPLRPSPVYLPHNLFVHVDFYCGKSGVDLV